MVIRGRQVSDHREPCISEGLCDCDMKSSLEEPKLSQGKWLGGCLRNPEKVQGC